MICLLSARCIARSFFYKSGPTLPRHLHSLGIGNRQIAEAAGQLVSAQADEFKEYELSDFGETTVQAVLDHKGDKGQWLCCTTKDSAQSAVMQMLKAGSGSLVILDGSQTHATNQLASIRGLVTENDYLKKIVEQGKDADTTRVTDIMTSREDLLTIGPDTRVMDAMDIMMEEHIRQLPVIENGKMIGMISCRDLVSVMVAEHRKAAHLMLNYFSGGY